MLGNVIYSNTGLGIDLDDAYADYERVRARLKQRGSALSADGLDVPAIAALLVMNNDDADVDDTAAALSEVFQYAGQKGGVGQLLGSVFL